VRTNRAAPAFFGSFIDLEKIPKPRNLLELMFDPQGLQPFVEQWDTVACGLLQRVRREAVGQGVDARLRALLTKLLEYPGVTDLKIESTPQSPVLSITFVRDARRYHISYWSQL
jgi:hypothetical protein